MFTVYYERYWCDFMRKQEEKTFYSIQELEDWIFGSMRRNYDDSLAMFFPTPEILKNIGDDPGKPSRIEFKPSASSETYWIHEIDGPNGIEFSDGTRTSGQKHWSRNVREWCIRCDKKRKSPKFNFVD